MGATRKPARRAAVPRALAPVTIRELIDLGPGDHTHRLRGADWAWRASPDKPMVVGVDIGKNSAVAVIGPKGQTVFRALPVLPTDTGVTADWCTQLWALLCEVRDEIAECDADGNPIGVVVIEDTWLGKDPQAHARLARTGGVVVGIASTVYLPCVLVQPSSWQSAMIGKLDRVTGKEASLRRARQEFGEAITSEHLADAALMAKWAWGLPARRH